MTCAKCATGTVPPENGARAPLCRPCRAEQVICGAEAELGVMDRAFADVASGRETPWTWEELLSLQPASPFEQRKIRCSVCGASENYDPMKVRQGWPCERCHRHGLACCMAYVVHKDLGMKAVAMCKFCRAELELSGSPCDEAHKPLPGAEIQKDRSVEVQPMPSVESIFKPISGLPSKDELVRQLKATGDPRAQKIIEEIESGKAGFPTEVKP